MYYNFSKDIDYHTQRNNRLIPHESCNTTAMVMALKQAGYSTNWGPGQPEDVMTALLRSKESYKAMERLAPWVYNSGKASHPPNEVHTMLAWAANKLIDSNVVNFQLETSLHKIGNHVLNGGGCVVSGLFPAKGKRINHVVSVAGLRLSYYKVMLDIFIDDPYGDYRTLYREHQGNNIEIPFDEALTLLKPVKEDKKWAHLIAQKKG